jgi:hypothetical protein
LKLNWQSAAKALLKCKDLNKGLCWLIALWVGSVLFATTLMSLKSVTTVGTSTGPIQGRFFVEVDQKTE